MNAVTSLTLFLKRHPWSSESLLLKAFGKHTLATLIPKSKGLIKMVATHQGRLWADRGESEALLSSSFRLSLARSFLVDALGMVNFFQGWTPGEQADGEGPGNGVWWRVFVDPGDVAPEALPFLRRPPATYGRGVRDVVLTTGEERMGFLVGSLSAVWGGRETVTVWVAGTSRYATFTPSRKIRVPWKPFTEEHGELMVWRRRAPVRGSEKLGLLQAQMRDLETNLLIQSGNIPLLDTTEAAFLVSRTLQDRGANLDGIRRLMKFELLKENTDGRLTPSSLGLELLTAYWGTRPGDLARFHPWPQRCSRGGRRVYSTAWYRARKAHSALQRQLCLALVDGSRRLRGGLNQPDVHLRTTVGARLIYRDNTDARLHWLSPDGILDATYYRAGDPQRRYPLRKYLLLVEVDMGTEHLQRLVEKIKRLSDIASDSSQKMILVWVTATGPIREENVLRLFGGSVIPVYTATTQRLGLPARDDWWLQHSIPEGELSYRSLGGLAPWRPVWRVPGREGMYPLLSAVEK